MTAPRRALALIDGEHYAPVVRDALGELPYEFVAAHVVGGTEKLRGGEEYGVPLVGDVEEGIRQYEPHVVVDLSDEPVLGPVERFRVASRVLARGVPYEGADFRFDPPQFEPYAIPSLGVVGTGKRVGKTALTGYLARLLTVEAGLDVVVVAMGRGGPRDPEVAEVRPTVDMLLEQSRRGRHAASDYLETAALTGVVTVGCRRCGGGLAGTPATSNVARGAQVARDRDPQLVIFDGSGSALPPIAVRRRVLAVGAHQPPEIVTGFLNAYRILLADLVIVTMAEHGTAYADVRGAIDTVRSDVPVVAAVLRPRPASSVAGRRVAFFSTAPLSSHAVLAEHLRAEHGADVVHVSGALARRDELRRELAAVDADVYLVEIKAAAIDVVAEHAAAHGIEVVFADNEVRAIDGEPDLDRELRVLADAALAEPALAR